MSISVEPVNAWVVFNMIFVVIKTMNAIFKRGSLSLDWWEESLFLQVSQTLNELTLSLGSLYSKTSQNNENIKNFENLLNINKNATKYSTNFLSYEWKFLIFFEKIVYNLNKFDKFRNIFSKSYHLLYYNYIFWKKLLQNSIFRVILEKYYFLGSYFYYFNF